MNFAPLFFQRSHSMSVVVVLFYNKDKGKIGRDRDIFFIVELCLPLKIRKCSLISFVIIIFFYLKHFFAKLIEVHTDLLWLNTIQQN